MLQKAPVLISVAIPWPSSRKAAEFGPKQFRLPQEEVRGLRPSVMDETKAPKALNSKSGKSASPEARDP
jgi:hypothetical protein